MEAIILAPPAPAQNVARQQDQQTSADTSSEEFAPVLDQEVKRTQTKNDPKKTDWNVSEASPAEQSLSSAGDFQENSTAFLSFSNTTNSQITKLSEETTLLSGKSGHEQTIQTTGKFSTKMTSEVLSSLKTGVLTQNASSQTALPASTSSVQTSAVVTEAVQTSDPPRLSKPSRAETLLIEQIQQLLSKNQNNGPIVIQNSNRKSAENLETLSGTLLTETNSKVQIQQQVTAAMTLAGESSPEVSKTANLEGTRQDTIGQYFKARLDNTVVQTETDFQQSSTEQQSDKGQGKEGMQSSPMTSTTSLLEPGTSETQSTTQFTLSTPTTETSHTTVEGKFAPGTHTPIQEHEIVNNLIQRFNVNPRLKTSNLSIQLHPAELGELKLNIMVKDDSIKANIIAQSQQIIETIEKHMPKLRAVLESQGFSIDTFEITLDSKTDSHQELFHEQFASQQQHTRTDAKSSSQSKDAFEKELENVDITAMTAGNATAESGVNLTV